MTHDDFKHRVKCTPEQVDEAAVWMTLLHASNRSERTEQGFRRWLAANPANPMAFEKVSVAHEITAALPRGSFPRSARWERAGFRTGFYRATTALAASVVLAALGVFLYWRSAGIASGVGEQRVLTLADGSQVFLNTDTRVVVKYDERRRHVDLKSGEALFDVAKGDAQRPFVVSAGGREIRALGTSFVVRRDAQRVSVTLMEGKVVVAPIAGDSGVIDGARTLNPGQRVTFASSDTPIVDRPPLEKVAAWRTGHVQFDRVPLADAIMEMNRYSKTKLAFEKAETARIPITGIFRATATSSFALAVAAAYRLQVIEKPDEIMLAGLPRLTGDAGATPIIATPR